MSNITLNIVEPGTPPSPTPIDPVTPNTGLFTSGIGGPEATAIGAVLVLTIAAIVVAILYRKQKKSGKVTKLVHVIDSTKAIITSKKRLSAALTAIALLASAGTFVALAKNGVNASEGDEQSQTEGTNDSSLTVDVSSEELTIEVADAPVFAVLPVDITVEEATLAGYTLTAHTDNTDLVSTTNPDNIIPMVTLPESSAETLESSETTGELSPLTDNTYGLALGEEPTSKDAAVYMPLSIDPDIPTIIKSMPEYTPTEENDTTTIYYGFYITPDTPYGTYKSSDIYYSATINTTPVTFDGNGLYFNDDSEQTINEVEYIAVSEEGKEYNINQIVSGEYKKPSQDLPYKFLGWSTDKNATVPTYETEEKIAEFLPISPNTPITLYAVWQKATTITYDGNGADSGAMDTQTIIAGESDSLYENAFVKDGYHFTGWNTVAEPTEQDPGKAYVDQGTYIAPVSESQDITLYAQWEKMPVIGDLTYMQDFASLSAEDKVSVLNSMSQETSYTLKDKRDEQDYTVAKLKDDNIWMTKNLNLTGGTEITSELSNVPYGYTLPTANGFQSGNKLPASSTSGFNDNTKAFVYNSTKTSGTNCTKPGCYSYYSWTAATAGSGLSITADDTDAPYSICPKGWKLPNSRSTVAGNSDFYQLAVAYGMNSSVIEEYTANFYNQAGPSTTPNFLLTSYYLNGSFGSVGSYGYYWSSTSSSSTYAQSLSFGSSYVSPAYAIGGRKYGYAVRCIAE